MVLLRLSGYSSSGVLPFMRRGQILATGGLFAQNGALLTYRRTFVYNQVLYVPLLTSFPPVTFPFFFYFFTLRFWCAFRFFEFAPSLTGPGACPQSVPGYSRG
jgi:hypothetical protein